MKYILALIASTSAIALNKHYRVVLQNPDYNDEGQQYHHNIPLPANLAQAPPGGSPDFPSPPTTPGQGFPTTQQPGMGKDWPAGYGENGFEKNKEFGGYHPEMYEHEPSHKWADPYYDPFDQKLHFRNGTLMPINRNSREMATKKVGYTNG